MKRNKILWLGAILITTTFCGSCSNDSDLTTPTTTRANGNVSIADVSSLIDYLLSGQWP